MRKKPQYPGFTIADSNRPNLSARWFYRDLDKAVEALMDLLTEGPRSVTIDYCVYRATCHGSPIQLSSEPEVVNGVRIGSWLETHEKVAG